MVQNSAPGSRSNVGTEQKIRTTLKGVQQPGASSSKDASTSAFRSGEKHNTLGARSVPLGLGLGGLERKVDCPPYSHFSSCLVVIIIFITKESFH